MDIINTNTDIYNFVSDVAGATANALAPRLWNPGSWFNGPIVAALNNASDEFGEGAFWMESSEAGWLELIGAGGGGVIVWTEEEVWVCDTPLDELPQNAEDPCDPWDGECWQTIQVPRWIPNPDLPNDGVVTVASSLLPGAARIIPAINDATHFSEQEDGTVQFRIRQELRIPNAVAEVFEILD